MSDIFDLFGAKRMLIVDVLNLIFRGLHGYSHLNPSEEETVSHLYGTFRMLASQKDKFSGATLHFMLDGYPKHRYEAFPGYKGDRVKKDGAGTLLDEAIQMLRMVPGFWYSHPDAEADDIAATLVAENPTTEIRVVSSDKDLWAFASDLVTIVGNKSEQFTPPVIEEKIGVPPRKVAMHKIFFGDNSDKIPPVGSRIRKNKLIPLLMKAASVDQVYQMLDGEHDLSKNEVKKLHDGRSVAEMNAKVVPLVLNVPYKVEEVKGDQDAMVALFKERNCPSLVPQTEVFFGKMPPIEIAEGDDLSGLFD